MNKRVELVAEITIIANILYRMGFDNIVNNSALFVSFLNELGLKTTTGKELSRSNYRIMVDRLSDSEKSDIYKLLDLDICYV